jgi:hypothetical protein
MRAYLVTSGSIFGLITLAHVLRAVAEGIGVFADPFFVAATLAAAALSVWAGRLFQSRPAA